VSELIRNREHRKKVLKELIMELHQGKSPDEVRERFAKLIEGVSANEISEMEQSLIIEGMPVEEVQRLCDVHAAVFKGSIAEIHRSEDPGEIPGHPIQVFKAENRAIENLINNRLKPDLERFKNDHAPQNAAGLLEAVNSLWEIDKHYSRKENLLFPYLEKAGITAPPKVMWGVDDEIRAEIKRLRTLLAGPELNGHENEAVAALEKLADKITEMIFKEESILFPMAADAVAENEWLTIATESDAIGYCLYTPQAKWHLPSTDGTQGPAAAAGGAGAAMVGAPAGLAADQVDLQSGVLTAGQITALLNHLPIDVTFIDQDDTVRYFSMGKERIFARTKTVIGRKVQNCHPPASVHVVEKILEDFKSGRKDHEDFWLHMGGVFAYIRYFAVRDASGQYLGTLEVTQNIAPIVELQGEKRLLSE